MRRDVQPTPLRTSAAYSLWPRFLYGMWTGPGPSPGRSSEPSLAMHPLFATLCGVHGTIGNDNVYLFLEAMRHLPTNERGAASIFVVQSLRTLCVPLMSSEHKRASPILCCRRSFRRARTNVGRPFVLSALCVLPRHRLCHPVSQAQPQPKCRRATTSRTTFLTSPKPGSTDRDLCFAASLYEATGIRGFLRVLQVRVTRHCTKHIDSHTPST